LTSNLSPGIVLFYYLCTFFLFTFSHFLITINIKSFTFFFPLFISHQYFFYYYSNKKFTKIIFNSFLLFYTKSFSLCHIYHFLLILKITTHYSNMATHLPNNQKNRSKSKENKKKKRSLSMP
jgi:hypothetical protein